MTRLLWVAAAGLTVGAVVSSGFAPASARPAQPSTDHVRAVASTRALAGGLPSDSLAPRPSLVTSEVREGPWRLPGDDGRTHLVYTAVLTNVGPIPVVPTEVTVADEHGRLLQTLSGEALLSALEGIIFTGPLTQVEPSQQAVIGMDVIAPASTTAIVQRVRYRASDGAAIPVALQETGIRWRNTSGTVPVLARRPVVISSPLKGSGWVNQNACCMTSSHSMTRISVTGTWHAVERFAIDWIRERDAASYAGDGATNDDHYAYGAPVYSATDGVVIDARDDMPELAPGTAPIDLPDSRAFMGNHVTVKMADDVFVLYAHLRLGTVKVHEGDVVHAGDRLGDLGNSGNTTGAHLHFQLFDRADFWSGTSLPFVIDDYTRHWSMPVGGPDGTEQWTRSLSRQHDTYPLALGVFTFR